MLKEKKTHWITLKCFRKQGVMLFNFMIIFQWYLKQNMKQLKRLTILIPTQMLQRLPIALAQARAGNNSENLLHEIRQIVYFLYQSKQITKKVYNNVIKSIKV